MKSLGCLESLGGKPFDLTDALNMMARDPEPDPLTEPQEGSVQALYGRGTKTKRLPIRLVILPLPSEKAENARKKVRRSGSKRQHETDPRSELAAGFMILATPSFRDTKDLPFWRGCAEIRIA
jgi:hypothetical protein